LSFANTERKLNSIYTTVENSYTQTEKKEEEKGE